MRLSIENLVRPLCGSSQCLLRSALLFAFMVHVRTSAKFEDDVLYHLAWAGEIDNAMKLPQADSGSVVSITTSEHEQYVCNIPMAVDSDNDDNIDYMGPSPDQLLAPLYAQRSCTYRIEMYWTYELCHGRFILQYHEEKDVTKRVKRQEYYLGQYQPETGPPSLKSERPEFDEMKPPRRKFEEQDVAYFPVVYSQGTICDINNQPRRTTVQYICDKQGKNQIEALNEVSSCEYELVVLTPLLCQHPAFRPKEAIQKEITCFARPGSPPQPHALAVWHNEQSWDIKQQFNNHKETWTTKGSDGSAGDERSGHQAPPRPKSQQPDRSPGVKREPEKPLESDDMLMKSFLAGTYCLYGGAGWWKHEYCHGKQVIQFHEEPNQPQRIEINLGSWDEQVHLNWIAENPQKAPIVVSGRVHQVTHLYTNGDFCEETQRKRQVEVRLRCRDSKGSGNAVTLYILEPKTCEYILGVESAMFCELLQTANEQGLFVQQQP